MGFVIKKKGIFRLTYPTVLSCRVPGRFAQNPFPSVDISLLGRFAPTERFAPKFQWRGGGDVEIYEHYELSNSFVI